MFMELFLFVLGKEVKKFYKNNVKFNIIGDLLCFFENLCNKVDVVYELICNNMGL